MPFVRKNKNSSGGMDKKNRRKSCGCLAKKAAQDNTKRYQNIIKKMSSNKGILREEANSNNKTTGIRGVCYIKSTGRYVAQIGYQGKNYVLLRSTDIEQCIAARKAAEKVVREDFLEWYEKLKKEQQE